ncbi:hypothetical protein A3L11_02385 [Thermococcus siculi]|uniref:Uncharacterized protein n=1 Tax=Thermococcus siculi TaxID=72803 RepID=A0A2Z2MKG8_9EURY|nr:hypothetical protein [Thermococcus siculi]ASJ08135.1 hypothetical protein A3L11_02385 [Thermococcus siculi]
MEKDRKKLKIYIPGIKFPLQDRGVSPPTSLPTPSPREWGFAPRKTGNYVSQPFLILLNTGGGCAPYNPQGEVK